MRSRSAMMVSSRSPGSRGGQGQRDRGVTGEVAHQFQVARVECGVVLVAGYRDDADDRIVGAQWHHDRRSLADVGERLDGVPEGLRDDRATGSEDPAAGRPVDGDALADDLVGVEADGRRYDQCLDSRRRYRGTDSGTRTMACSASVNSHARAAIRCRRVRRCSRSGHQGGGDLPAGLRPSR